MNFKKPHLAALLVFGLATFFAFKDFSELDSASLIRTTDQPLMFFSERLEEPYNVFEQDEGLFRLEYRNHLAFKENHGIYFLEDIRNHKPVFQLFEWSDDLDFDEDSFTCQHYMGPNLVHRDKTVCFTNSNPDQQVANLELFGEKDAFFKNNVYYLSKQGGFEMPDPLDRYAFFTRAQMLQLALGLRYPDTDFSQYADDCFEDVTRDHPLSGYICFARDQEIVIGTAGFFYPESSINLFGVIKILFETFEVDDLNFDESRLDAHVFEQMTKGHYAYRSMAKALYEGIFENQKDVTLWSNRHAYQGEVLQITRNFLHWLDGKTLKNYTPGLVTTAVPPVFVQTPDFLYRFKEEKTPDVRHSLPIEDVQIRDGAIYVADRGGVYFEVMPVDESRPIVSVRGIQNYEAQQIGLYISYEDGEEVYYETNPKTEQFRPLMTRFVEGAQRSALNKLDNMGLLPHSAEFEGQRTAPHFEIFMEEADFLDLFVHRTSNQRYPAHLKITYPDGGVLERSIFIKTRGNATRGYIKSSYTIEAFEDFGDHAGFEGDEFLAVHDEIKMRSFINDETMIREKLFYQTFEDLGHPAPDFFETSVDINGVSMGFYQATEPIKDPFFERRDLEVKDYYYAQNEATEYNTNLKYYVDDETTLSQYDIHGDSNHLLSLIKSLEANDPNILSQIDTQSVFDFALLVYLSRADDSLTHNYYIYWDESKGHWVIFPWDADETFENVRRYSDEGLRSLTSRNQNVFNQLVYYVFQHLDDEAFQVHFERFELAWQKVDLIGQINDYQNRYGAYLDFDNALWNDKHLERRKATFNTNQALDELKEELHRFDDLFNDDENNG